MTPSIRKTIYNFPSLCKDSMKGLLRNDPLRMAGATAFFTTFALPPILIIIIQVLSLAFNRKNISRQLFRHLEEIIGKESVHQLVSILAAFRKLAYNWPVTVLGFIFLVFVATTLFKVIRGSINQIWAIRISEKMGFWLRMRNRGQSIIVILVAGILFVFGLVAEWMQSVLGKYMQDVSYALAFYLNNVVGYLISVIIVMTWFSVMFRYLPDGRPKWSIALVGGLFTSILFNIGKLILHWLLSYSNINTVYGASASLVLLLLFVFYCSLILYFGASFTCVWAGFRNEPIRTLTHAVHYETSDVEKE